MHEDYHVKRIGEADFTLLIPLMKNCFGMDASIDYFRWKYTDNPAGSFIGFVAEHKETGEIGGYYGVIPQLFKIEGEPSVVYQSCDTMTHSEHRRRGLFRLLATTCYSELDKEGKLFVIGFGGGQSTPGFLKFGWKHLFDFKYYFKPKALCAISRGAWKKGELNDKPALEALKEGVRISRSKLKGSLTGNRTDEQVMWRLSNPYHQYRVAWTDDPSTFVVYYVEGDKMVVFDSNLDNRAAGKKIMGFLSDKVCNENLKGMLCFAKENGTDAQRLKKFGFISNPFSFGPLKEKVPFIYYSSEENMKTYLDPVHWEVTSFDHDSL